MNQFFTGITLLMISGLLGLGLCLSSPDLAFATPPVQKNETLEAIGKLKEDLARQTKAHDATKHEAQALAGDLKKTRAELIATAQNLQENETLLGALDKKIHALEAEKRTLSEFLKKDRVKTAHLLLALERLRRVPVESLVLRPDAPLKTAQTALLMREILPVLISQTRTLQHNLARLETVSRALAESQDKALLISETLKTKQKNLDRMLATRKALYASTHADLKAQQATINRISTESRNLQDLVKRLETERLKQMAERKEAKQHAAHVRRVFNDFTEALPITGKARLPVAGAVVTGFNEPDHFGAPSQGWDIESRAGAVVVAPMGGVIRFAGAFKNYGNMIIIEHEKGWHSLIAGLEKIDTVVGQSLSAGEPVGALHKASSGGNPVLYYELRYNGKPVNPAHKFETLG